MKAENVPGPSSLGEVKTEMEVEEDDDDDDEDDDMEEVSWPYYVYINNTLCIIFSCFMYFYALNDNQHSCQSTRRPSYSMCAIYKLFFNMAWKPSPEDS